MSEIYDNVMRVREEIAAAALSVGRAAEDITLVAASKMNSAARVREAISAGADAAGENRVQEMLQKSAEGAYTGAPLHFIGKLQTNKVRHVVGLCGLIESVDSPELLALIGKCAVSRGITQNVLIEVNIGGEASKGGVLPEELPELLQKSAATQGVFIQGLMCIPPPADSAREQMRFFDGMYNVFVDIRDKKYDNISMRYLSMGMSDSFSSAIRAGASIVRVGSRIFGARAY
ncbi:MAG: YggS family pyridoxal phosphate-dependent enzyme [Oscillospiraceae bacterium]|jgi:pyridoxal phosphate enzyme (YggS family)|nr:YggS family pyridoxal phosphate-dependent enzyme [Oscillospiraceae bacterium]